MRQVTMPASIPLVNSSVLTCVIILFVLLASSPAISQSSDTSESPRQAQRVEWYKKINVRGYVQLRYNKLFETNPDLQCEQCDRSWGGDGGFYLRRIRLVFSGQVHERVYFYVQPDFASSLSTGELNFAQIRDIYFDIGLDKDNEFRFRIGQSKIPFGFENLQSSRHRLPLDRNDGLNSAIANERDLGIFFYWAPKEIRSRFKYLTDSGLKGSGDYGVFGLGVFNGQGSNRREENDQPHVVARLTYPIKIGKKQIVEPGIQAYRGRAVVSKITEGVTSVNERREFFDQRAAASLIIYPQPFGLMAEYNWGTGPEYDPATHSIQQKNLQGGYTMISYRYAFGEQVIIPFTRYHYYSGGKKHELDARSYTVREMEIGTEWQVNKNFEIVAMYTMSDRRFEDGLKPSNFQNGNLLRLQFQLNFP